MTALRLWDDTNDFVIAESSADADIVWCEHMGEKPEDREPDAWVAWDDGRVFTFVDDDGGKVAKTAREWVAEHGRGYFASRDY